MTTPAGVTRHDQPDRCNFTAATSPQAVDRCLPTLAVSRAVHLVGAVHDEGPEAVAEILTGLDRQALYDLTVTLAAMVPDQYTPVELLAWNDARHEERTAIAAASQPTLFSAVLINGRPLRPHGTHAAFARHRIAGEEPCDACCHGEREYQRTKKQKQRAALRDVEGAA